MGRLPGQGVKILIEHRIIAVASAYVRRFQDGVMAGVFRRKVPSGADRLDPDKRQECT
ncbi:MAG: hypothetical protein V3S77_06440 [Acidiferrobacterales bacterium]